MVSKAILFLALPEPKSLPGQAVGQLFALRQSGQTLLPFRTPMSTSTEPNKIIYSMIGVGKTHDKKLILKDIYLSYFYGAKIGVLGLNGSGKSSLLRILGGVDTNFDGQISKSPGYTVGLLEQEP